MTRGQGPAPGDAGSGRPEPEEEPGGWTGPRLHDVDEQWEVVGDPGYLRGVLVTLRTDQVQMPGGELAKRDVVEHPGAVAIVALDRDDRVLLIRHYRHPAGHLLWEIPAGLRDVAGEDPRATAERELLEEAGYRASDWQELVDFFTSPGILTERVRVFLARGVTFVPESERGGHAPEHEEAHLLVRWVPLHQAVRLFLAGDLHNGVTAVGILSAYAVQQGGFAALREEDVLPER